MVVSVTSTMSASSGAQVNTTYMSIYIYADIYIYSMYAYIYMYITVCDAPAEVLVT